MHYRYAGTGETTILFLHMSGSSSEEFEGVGNLLADRGYRVFALDLLAFGGSDNPSHFYYSMDEHIATILAFMDALGITSAYLYGNLATANMAARMAVYHRDRVDGLLLANPLYNPEPDYYRRRGRTAAYCKVDVTADGSFLQELWNRSDKYGEPPEVTERRCADLHKAGEWGETLHWALHEDTPFGEYLDKIEPKTVIIAYSFFRSSWELLQKAAEKLTNGVFDVYQDATPYVARVTPEKVADMVCKHIPIH